MNEWKLILRSTDAIYDICTERQDDEGSTNRSENEYRDYPQ